MPRNACCCPECGADEKAGWSDEPDTGHLGTQDESFDYDDFVRREFGPMSSPRPRGIAWVWWCVAVALILLGLWTWLGGLFRR